MMRRPRFAAVALAAAVTSGCFQVDQTLTLERNLSGTASFTMKIDVEPMMAMMLRMQREAAGKTGDPTPEELAKAKADFLAASKKQTPVDLDADKLELASKLPAGVKLVDASLIESGMTMAVGLVLGFDQVAKLAQIQLPSRRGGMPVDAPFGGLQVVDDGKTILLTSPTVAEQPLESLKGDAPPDPEMQKFVQDMIKGVRVGFRITAPFEVIQHNAHRREGNTLVWEYDLKAIEKLTKDELAHPIKVRYRK